MCSAISDSQAAEFSDIQLVVHLSVESDELLALRDARRQPVPSQIKVLLEHKSLSSSTFVVLGVESNPGIALEGVHHSVDFEADLAD